MKREWQRFAPIGLYLSVLAALASAGLYIVFREFNLPLQISVAVIILGLALFAVLDPERVRQALTGRQARYGSNALVMTLAFTGILVVVNYLVYQNPKRWDLTENQQFTLAPETIDTLKNLPQPVKAFAFFTTARPTDQAEGLLDQYKFHGNGNFDYEFINPDANPVAAQQAGVTTDGTVVLEMGDHQEKVTLVSERELTAGLVRMISPGSRAVYFLIGHGEYNPEEPSGDRAYNQVKTTLENKNYTVKTLNLLTSNQIPEDAQVIVIAGPDKPVSQEEVDQLKGYVDKGGALIVMEEPTPVTQFPDAPDPMAEYLSNDWGIKLGQDMVVDLTSNQPFIAVANQYGNHLITQKMQGMVAFFPTVRSVSAGQSNSDATLVELVMTASQSWAETDLKSLTDSGQAGQQPNIQPDEGVDLMGPVPLAVAGENTSTSGRVVVFGDADFASDNAFTQYGNGDLFVNAVDWAAEEENLINLTPKDNTTRLLVPPRRYTMNLILLGTVFVLPGIVLLSGVGVWFQRRRRG
jgi:ABC-type uncharacterized transport system involved in gliding motility auxiliary subunit